MDDETYLRELMIFLAESLIPIHLVKILEQDYINYLDGKPPTPTFGKVRQGFGNVERSILRRAATEIQFIPQPPPLHVISDADIAGLEEFLDKLEKGFDELN